MQREGIFHPFIEAQGSYHLTGADSYSMLLAVAGTYYTLTGLTQGTTRLVTVTAASGTFTIQVPGRYLFTAFASITPSAAMDLFADLHINGTAVGIPTHAGFKNSQDAKTLAGSGIVILNKGDILTMRLRSDTAGVSAGIPAFNMAVCRIGSK